MTALDAVREAADARRDAEVALHDAVRRLHAAIRAAHDDRWRIRDIATAAGMARVTVHKVIAAGQVEDGLAA